VRGGYIERGRRPRSIVLVGVLVALVAGCGSQSTGTTSGTTSAASLSPPQEAVVAFQNAMLAAMPARKSSLEAALRLKSATAEGHVNAAAAQQALSEYLANAKAWQASMAALPAADRDVEAMRARYTEGAADEVQFVSDYAAFFRHARATGVVDKATAEQIEALRRKQLAANSAASAELNSLVARLGGEAAFHGRLGIKRMEELLSSMKQQAGG
jgi:hypothetical protein